ncbi:acetyltransferase [Holdemanella biformis]|uniref:Transferase n=1 Tax=Holdemanella biformis TaxID=1735 RepID=A0A412J5V0_9FIRM|nr:acetyltransferase [Holdemanella biformis]RGS47528.1 transferase [Holdemanella biformis]
MKDLYIIGAGGFGREVAWIVERINSIKPTWNLKGFIDDNETLWGSTEGEYHVFGGCEYLSALEGVYAVCAVGSSNVRKKIIEKLKDTSVKFATLVDPSVLYSNSVKIGEGAIVCAGTIITVDVNIGDHVIVNLDCTIGHDAVIDDFVTIYPSVNVSGNVLIGECSELGTGTQIIQGKKVISNTIIGAGAIVVKDCLESGTYVGSPAKKIK